MDLREFKKNNEIYYRKILNMSKRQRVGRKNHLLKNSTISFIRSEKRNGFYLVDEKKNVHPKTFVETIKIFKAKKDEKAIQLHKNHHLQVDIALKEFEKEQYEKISENQGVNTTLGPQSKQALAFLDLCSRADFLNLV